MWRLLLILFVSAAYADVAKLSVRGDAILKKPADQAIITIGVVTEADSARDAMEANSKKMRQVIDALKAFGLEKGEYQTGRFQVTPQYSHPDKDQQDKWKPKIVGYQVTHNLNITTGLLKQLGDLLDVVNGAGVNSIEDIQFTIKDKQAYRKEAIYQATSLATQDAKNLADAAGVQLNRILSITLDQPVYNHSPVPMMMAKMGTEIVAGDVDVTATVNITYEITG